MTTDYIDLHKTDKTCYARARENCHSSEKVLEAKLRKEVEARGGKALKLLSQLHRGLPDRLILLPGGWTIFVEIKTTGKKPTELQRHCHGQLRQMDFPVFVVDSEITLKAVLEVVDELIYKQ